MITHITFRIEREREREGGSKGWREAGREEIYGGGKQRKDRTGGMKVDVADSVRERVISTKPAARLEAASSRRTECGKRASCCHHLK